MLCMHRQCLSVTIRRMCDEETWKTHIIRPQLYIVMWQSISKAVVSSWLRNGNYSHQSLMIEDCRIASIISLRLMWRNDTISRRDNFFQ